MSNEIFYPFTLTDPDFARTLLQLESISIDEYGLENWPDEDLHERICIDKIPAYHHFMKYLCIYLENKQRNYGCLIVPYTEARTTIINIDRNGMTRSFDPYSDPELVFALYGHLCRYGLCESVLLYWPRKGGLS